MALRIKVLGSGKLSTTQAAIYGPVPSGTAAVLRNMRLVNPSGAGINIRVFVKRTGQTARYVLQNGRTDNLHLYLHTDPCDVGYDLVTQLHRYRMEGHADVSDPNFSVRDGLEDSQLNRFYNLFDVTVLPSVGEGFGLPIIESLAAGVPVVATDCSACSELVRGRGELVRVLTMLTEGINLIEHAVIDVEDLAACIGKLYRNPDLAKQHAEAGLAFAQTLTWDSLIPKWLELIRSMRDGESKISSPPAQNNG